MQKIRLITHASVAPEVLAVVQKAGLVEFADVTDERLQQNEPKEFEFNYVSARLDFAVDFLTRYAHQKTGIAAALEGTQERVDEERIADVATNFYATDIVDAAQDVQKALNDTQRKIKELGKERVMLLPWKRVPLIVGRDYDTEHTRTIFAVRSSAPAQKGSKKNKAHHALAEAFDDAGVLYHIVSVDRERIIVTWEKGTAADAQEVLKAQGYEVVRFAQRRGTPAEEIARIDRALVKAQEEVRRLEEKARTLARHLPDLKIVSDHTLWQKDRHTLFARARRTENVLVYEGWCPQDRLSYLKEAIAGETNLCVVEKVTPAEGEQPPVEIRNSALVQPFEAVTRLYGLPGDRDLDPTPYLAGFFFIFFGFCLTDVGYGVILAAVTGYLLWRYDVLPGTKKMLQLLFLGGLASLIAGLFFGGYFGFDMAKMPQFLQRIQVFDPIANPMPVFYFALALGVVQVMTGLIAAIVRGYTYGETKDALLTHVPWLFFFGALIAWGAAQTGIVHFEGAGVLIGLAVASIVLTQGRAAKNPVAKLFKGVMSLYDSVSYFADILSYSRLLALGLATSALAFAVNLIAGMVAGPEGERTIVGLFFAGVVLVVGHLFNLAINAFGAFIHSARLQFVEFFGKFITGTGRVFAPCKRRERNVVFRRLEG